MARDNETRCIIGAIEFESPLDIVSPSYFEAYAEEGSVFRVHGIEGTLPEFLWRTIPMRMVSRYPAVQDRRCCNIHGKLLECQRSKSEFKFLACPVQGCSVGVWSNSKASLPASNPLRQLRKEVFDVAKTSSTACNILIEAATTKGEGIGCWNQLECIECLQLMGGRILEPAPVALPQPVRSRRTRRRSRARLVDPVKQKPPVLPASSKIIIETRAAIIREIDLD